MMWPPRVLISISLEEALQIYSAIVFQDFFYSQNVIYP